MAQEKFSVTSSDDFNKGIANFIAGEDRLAINNFKQVIAAHDNEEAHVYIVFSYFFLAYSDKYQKYLQKITDKELVSSFALVVEINDIINNKSYSEVNDNLTKLNQITIDFGNEPITIKLLLKLYLLIEQAALYSLMKQPIRALAVLEKLRLYYPDIFKDIREADRESTWFSMLTQLRQWPSLLQRFQPLIQTNFSEMTKAHTMLFELFKSIIIKKSHPGFINHFLSALRAKHPAPREFLINFIEYYLDRAVNSDKYRGKRPLYREQIAPIIEQAFTFYPIWIDLIVMKGRLLMLRGEFSHARDCFSQAIALHHGFSSKKQATYRTFKCGYSSQYS